MDGLGLLIIALAVLGVPLWWLAQTYRPAAIVSLEAAREADLRHQQARDEIQAIEMATVRLMRVVAAGCDLWRDALDARPTPRPTLARPVPDLNWTAGPVASTNSPGRVTFSTSDFGRG